MSLTAWWVHGSSACSARHFRSVLASKTLRFRGRHLKRIHNTAPSWIDLQSGCQVGSGKAFCRQWQACRREPPHAESLSADGTTAIFLSKSYSASLPGPLDEVGHQAQGLLRQGLHAPLQQTRGHLSQKAGKLK
jgi:hypothetical protein